MLCWKNKKNKTQKPRRFSVIFIYHAWMNFPVGLFVNIDNLSKMCNLDNSCKNLGKIDKYFPFRQVKSTRKFFHALKVFLNFYFVCFHWKIAWHLGKVNKKVKTDRISNWIDAQSSSLGFTSLNAPPCLLPKTTDKLLL